MSWLLACGSYRLSTTIAFDSLPPEVLAGLLQVRAVSRAIYWALVPSTRFGLLTTQVFRPRCVEQVQHSGTLPLQALQGSSW